MKKGAFPEGRCAAGCEPALRPRFPHLLQAAAAGHPRVQCSRGTADARAWTLTPAGKLPKPAVPQPRVRTTDWASTLPVPATERGHGCRPGLARGAMGGGGGCHPMTSLPTSSCPPPAPAASRVALLLQARRLRGPLAQDQLTCTPAPGLTPCAALTLGVGSRSHSTTSPAMATPAPTVGQEPRGARAGRGEAGVHPRPAWGPRRPE